MVTLANSSASSRSFTWDEFRERIGCLGASEASGALIGYLNAESGFCTCENCGKYFLFKRHREGTYIERVRPSKYCSDICQEQAKNKRLTARRKAERQKDRESRERG